MNQLPNLFQDVDTGQKVVAIYFPFNKDIGEKPADSRVVTVPVTADEMFNIGTQTMSGCWPTRDFEKRYKQITI